MKKWITLKLAEFDGFLHAFFGIPAHTSKIKWEGDHLRAWWKGFLNA